MIGWDWGALRRVRRSASVIRPRMARRQHLGQRAHPQPTTLDEIRRARPGRRIDRCEQPTASSQVRTDARRGRSSARIAASSQPPASHEYEDTKPRKPPIWFALNDDRPLFGAGMSQKTLALLHCSLTPLSTRQIPSSAPPPRETSFGGKLALSASIGCGGRLPRRLPIRRGRRTASFATQSSLVSREGKRAREVRHDTPE